MFGVIVLIAVAPEVFLADLAVLGALLYILVAFPAGDLLRYSSYSFVVVVAASSSLLAINLDSSYCRLGVLIDSQLLELYYKVGLYKLVVLNVSKTTAI